MRFDSSIDCVRLAGSVWIGPGVFEPFDQFPQGAIERGGHTGLLAPLHNRAIHEIDFGLPFCKNILQHAGAVFAGSVRAFLHHLARIAMQLDSESLGNRFPFADQIFEQFSGRCETGSGAMMQAASARPQDWWRR